MNINQSFKFTPFSFEGQLSPIRDMEIVDLKEKGIYLVAVGNFEGFRNDLGKAMAQPLVMYAIENQDIKPIQLGINDKDYWGSYRKISSIRIGNETCLIGVRNNDQPIVFKINKQ